MTMPAHSPLGASGASRWMKCPGSVSLTAGIKDAESDHAALGTAAHWLAAYCLISGKEAWEFIGSTIPDTTLVADADMANAVQVYLDAIDHAHPDRSQGNFWIERKFHISEYHNKYYGTSDACYWDAEARTLHVWDYKHGAGVIVEPQWNPQLLYYAAGMLADLDLWTEAETVTVHVAQPRGFHAHGPIREWSVSTDNLDAWLDDQLIPAMYWAESSTDLVPGEHCRFCPAAGRACPAVLDVLIEVEELAMLIEKKGAGELTNEQLGRVLELYEIAKIAATKANETVFNRLSAGQAVPGFKLVQARTNREWKDGAEKAVVDKFGEKAYTPQKLLSPAQIDKLPEGATITARYAFKPDGGLTVARAADNRLAVNRETKSLFKDVTKP